MPHIYQESAHRFRSNEYEK